MSRNERTGWRDEEISALHRNWGCAVPAVDVDFLLCEYSCSSPVAIIDYKRKDPSSLDIDNPVNVLCKLANRARLPFFIVCYEFENNAWKFYIIPKNQLANTYKDCVRRWITEREYFNFMYRVRNLNIDIFKSRDKTIKI